MAELSQEIQELQVSYYNESKDKHPIKYLLETQSITEFILPKWLTMIFGGGICQLCEKPEGNTHSYYLNYKCNYGNDKNGFIVCGKDACNFYIKTYIKILYNNLYITKQWQKLIYIRANNIFVSVTRSNGTIENDWLLCPDESKTTSSYDIIMTLILCCKKTNLTIPSDIFEYIYKILIDLYNDDIHLIFENMRNNEDKLTMHTLIKCFKGELCKNISIELL